MEPTLAQIKEYLLENKIDISNNISPKIQETINLFGNNDLDVYYQYYLDHSAEIVQWLNQELTETKKVIKF